MISEQYLETVILKRKDFFYQHATNLNDFRVDIEKHYEETRRIVDRLQASVYGEPMHSFKIRFPINWYEAFRERWFPKFLLKKKPIEYKVYESTSYAMYPELKPSFPDQKMFPLTSIEEVFDYDEGEFDPKVIDEVAS